MRRLELRVGEMDCPDCARRLQERLRRLDGVEESEGNPISRRLRVVFDPARLDAERIRREIGKLGYAAEEAGENEAEAGSAAAATWSSPDAYRTYGAAALFLVGLALEVAGASPRLLVLPLSDLRLPGLLFVAAAGLGGWNFLPAGIRAARALSLDMNFLMTVAIAGAVAVGLYLEAGAIAVLFSGAELLEAYSVDRARGSIRSLMELSPDSATVLRDGREVRTPASELEVDDRLLVRPGERIPADGVVEEGGSAVDQAPITGESMPVAKERGDEVYAGTINGDGYLRVRVERPQRDSTLARIIRLVEEAEGRKAPSERFVERFARRYTPVVTAGAVLLATVPPLVFGEAFVPWFVRGLTLLVVACPCAMVISTPVAVVSGITAAARNGVLIKGGVHLEDMGRVRVVAFDKTGTLTAGHPRVTDVDPVGDCSEEELLRLAAAVESRSEHPLARAVVREARHRGLAPDGLPEVRGFEALRGRGVRAEVDGREIRVGRPELFDGGEARAAGSLDRYRAEGKTAVLVGRPGRVLEGGSLAGNV
jgi:Cd2+/Zn2+-exporting ATPase